MDDDDSLSEYWRDVKAASQEKRARNREASAGFLAKNGIPFESHNYGAHLVVSYAGMVFDFWPGTGRFIKRGQPSVKGRGVNNLLRQLGVLG